MNLCIDVGNTRTKVALFAGDTLERLVYVENNNVEQILALATNHNVENIVLSTVGEHFTNQQLKSLSANYKLLVLNHKLPLPIDVVYDTPHTLGLDRIAAVVGAWAEFGGENCLVVDIGTCMTLDVLSEQGQFLGGNISPGVQMRLQAMHTFTAKLPLPLREETNSWIGKSTKQALLNGAQLGVELEIEGMIRRCEEEFGKFKVILTGGDANYFGKKIKKQIFVRPNLVLIGLNKILNYNVGKKK